MQYAGVHPQARVGGGERPVLRNKQMETQMFSMRLRLSEALKANEHLRAQLRNAEDQVLQLKIALRNAEVRCDDVAQTQSST